MIYETSFLPVLLFLVIVAAVLVISVLFARKTRSSKGFFAAGGTIPWTVNGIAFAGDYLSAASFLGICGMIAFYGYDGFLYSIGYLAGWVAALFVVAEPLKRRGKYTFTDALDAKFNSKGIKLTAGISTLIVSIFYLIPQMVGAGALVKPLLGLPHHLGVLIVGGVVIFIVATAGMKSTTYVQFIKGTLLIVFSFILVIFVLKNGIRLNPSEEYHEFKSLQAVVSEGRVTATEDPAYVPTGQTTTKGMTFVEITKDGEISWWSLDKETNRLDEALSIVRKKNGIDLYNSAPLQERRFFQVGHPARIVRNGKEVEEARNLNPFNFLSIIGESDIVLFADASFTFNGEKVALWYRKVVEGDKIMRPGLKFKVDEGATPLSRLNFISLMMALFFGTSALPHILIRYYTVPSPKDARKSTILAICAIGFFYILTLYIGLGAMINGVNDVTSSNMSAPLLAKSIGLVLFAIISAIAFATVLGTVSGLIVAASGAVAHDLFTGLTGEQLSDKSRVLVGKIAAIGVGLIAIILGILFKGVNVSFLVGLAFSIAASANFPAIIMLLFWKRTTAKGIAASVIVGMVLSVGIILVSPTMFSLYGLDPAKALIPLENPGIISIPASFLVLIIVSLLTAESEKTVPKQV